VGSLRIEPIDTVGAGDAFCGTLAAALDNGLALPDAMRCGAVAGSLACLEHGAMPSLPDADAIDARLNDLGPAEAF
jgi:ribokinase